MIRAVVVDYDGTLTLAGRPAPDVLDALAAARGHGLLVVLATGRIMAELRLEFPDVHDHVDAVVAENGAVLEHDGRPELLTQAVEPEVTEALDHRRLPYRRGRAILATKAEHRSAILDILTGLGLEHQLVRNRAELMVVPPGVDKASGVEAALAELGTSPHNAIAIGDAENDAALLRGCEIGAATANAVESLKRTADLILERADGAGVVEVLDGPVLAGRERLHPRRWQLLLGHDDLGEPVTIPASQVNVLLKGASGTGKSHVAGLLAEQLIHLHYSVLILDPEGDHEQLANLPGVFLTGGSQPILPPEQIVALLRHRAGSVVVDLSLQPDAEIAELYRRLAPLVEACRAASGLPHWILIDEAHEPLRHGSALTEFFTADPGYLIATYEPDRLDATVRAAFDVELDVGPEPPLVTVRAFGGPARAVRAAGRWTHHVRHWHKYARTSLPRERGFWFRVDPDHATGAVATSLAEFHHELRRCPDAVLRHHAAGHDLSRWVGEVFGDRDVASAMAAAEDSLRTRSDRLGVEQARHQMLVTLEERLLVAPPRLADADGRV